MALKPLVHTVRVFVRSTTVCFEGSYPSTQNFYACALHLLECFLNIVLSSKQRRPLMQPEQLTSAGYVIGLGDTHV